jgi:PBSX family phage terminase large subunit
VLSDKQLDFFRNSYHSFNIAAGAISSGKTFAQILRWYKHIYDCPDDVLLMMTGKTSESLYDNVIKDLCKLNPEDIIFKTSPWNHIKVLSKRIKIALASADNEKSWGRVQGKTVYGWLADEITQHPKNFVIMAQGRCRGDGKIWSKFWTCNPEHQEHFVLKDYIHNDKLDVYYKEFFLKDNPVNTKEYIDELENSYTGVFYERLIAGKWVNAEGLVYPAFNKDIHVIKPFNIPEDWEIIRGIDWGYKNPFVCLWVAVDGDGRAYLFNEYTETQRLLEYHAEQIKERGHTGTFCIADHDPQNVREFIQLGIQTYPAVKEVKAGIQKVSSRLQVQKDGKPRLFVFENCIHTIKEFMLYEWETHREGKAEKEEPKKLHDHCMDALRYIIMQIDRGRGSIEWA